MKKFLKLISVFCIMSLFAGCGAAKNEETEKKENNKKSDSEIVMTLGDNEYSRERFNLYFYNAQDEMLKSAQITKAEDIPDDFWTFADDNGKSQLEYAKELALDFLKDDAILYAKSVENGVELSSEERSYISSQISSLKQDNVSLAQFEYMGISVEELENYYKEMFTIQHLSDKLIEKGEIKIDDAAAKEQFESAFVKAQHILIPTVNQETQAPLSDEEVAKAKKKAEDILKRIKDGEDFTELMNKYCEDPGVKQNPDGYVFSSGVMVPEFEEAAFALAEGEVSELVTTSYGIHIIKRVPFDMSGTQEKESLKSVKSQLAVPELQKLLETWRGEMDIKVNEDALKDLKPFITNNVPQEGTEGAEAEAPETETVEETKEN